MKTTKLGRISLTASRLASGCWRIADPLDPNARAGEADADDRSALRAAYEAGCMFFDGADSYDGGRCEELMGRTLREVSGMREWIVITSKCGVRPAGSLDRSSPGR